MNFKNTIINGLAGAFLGATAIATPVTLQAQNPIPEIFNRLDRLERGPHYDPHQHRPPHGQNRPPAYTRDFHPLKKGAHQPGYYNRYNEWRGNTFNGSLPTCHIEQFNRHVGRNEGLTWRGSDCIKPMQYQR